MRPIRGKAGLPDNVAALSSLARALPRCAHFAAGVIRTRSAGIGIKRTCIGRSPDLELVAWGIHAI